MRVRVRPQEENREGWIREGERRGGGREKGGEIFIGFCGPLAAQSPASQKFFFLSGGRPALVPNRVWWVRVVISDWLFGASSNSNWLRLVAYKK